MFVVDGLVLDESCGVIVLYVVVVVVGGGRGILVLGLGVIEVWVVELGCIMVFLTGLIVFLDYGV